jgi:hypothetical protein
MANGGWYGTPEEWRRLEAPLIRLDPQLEGFAASFGAKLSKNHKDFPERSIQWGDGPQNLLQIYLADAASPTWNIWLCCSQDRGRQRFWRHRFLVERQPIEAFGDRLEALLFEGAQVLAAWSSDPSGLEFATEIEALS